MPTGVGEQEIQLVSILVLTLNRQEKLRRCLHSILVQDFPGVEIVVVDNDSIDGTATMLREDFSEVKYVGLSENRGGGGRNVGAEKAEGELLIILADDTRLPRSNTLSRIVENFRDNSDLGAAGFRLIDEEGEQEDWFHWQKIGNEREGYLSPTFPACAAAIRPEMFERTGGFWEPYFAYMEERDFATRILASGVEIRYFPLISIIHEGSGRKKELGRKFYFKTRNTFWYFWRNFALWTAFKKSFSFFFKQLWKALQKRKKIIYFIQALVDALRGFKRVIETRKPVPREKIDRVDGRFELLSEENQ